MLYRQRLIEELGARREEFVSFGREWAEEVGGYARRLGGLGAQTAAEIKGEAAARLEAGAARAPGALPSAELDREKSFVVPFGHRWRTHEESRAWAMDALVDRATFAADGSQLLPGRELSLPVAAVQVAWFENPHTRTGEGYRKEWDFKLVTPRELAEAAGGPATAADVVGLRRFELELEAVRAFLRRRRGWQERAERVPVAFFDGTLLLSTQRLRAETLKLPGAYIKALVETVKLSRETRVPLVGYIDQSYARDLVRLLDLLAPGGSGGGGAGGGAGEATVFDSQLFGAETATGVGPLFSNWGDRTVFCHCVREGLTEEFTDERGEPLVGFVYLQTTAPPGPPARLDIPAWIETAGLLEDVLDAVRGECVVGNGYPYALETADEAAVITARDREGFLRTMQEFAEQNSLAFRVSRKAVSKTHRR